MSPEVVFVARAGAVVGALLLVATAIAAVAAAAWLVPVLFGMGNVARAVIESFADDVRRGRARRRYADGDDEIHRHWFTAHRHTGWHRNPTRWHLHVLWKHRHGATR